MPLVPIMVEARSPLAFPERKTGVQFRRSLPYVPGATIYGALGALLGRTLGDEFDSLFRQIRCHNAYPAFAEDPWVRPLPMTAIEPKRSDKERRDEKDCARKAGKPYRPYADALYERVCWEWQRPPALIYLPTDGEGRAWEAVERNTFYALEDPKGDPWAMNPFDGAGIGTRKVDQRVLTRVAINRRRGTAEDTRLYSPLVISEVTPGRDKQLAPTRFLGSIVLPEGDKHILAALGDITHIGARQTTGIGAVRIKERLPAPTEILSIKERVAAMSKRFAEQIALYTSWGGRWRNAQGQEEAAPTTFFTVNLLSDAILFDQGWLPTNELNADLLVEQTQTVDSNGAVVYGGVQATLLRAFATTTTVGGWNISWQRPKATEVATTMGSLFVFAVAGELTDDDYAALARLEIAGIGERRAEGYGQVRICDEFHLLPPPVEEA